MQNKKRPWKKILSVILFMILGCGYGLFMIKFMEAQTIGLAQEKLSLLATFLLFFAAIYLQIIIHEGGHLLFGLLSGYKFSSFRICNIMLVKDEGKIKVKRLAIAGTLGQCLMCPPDLVNGTMPFLLYNFGGSIANVFSAILFFIALQLWVGVPALSFFLMYSILLALLFAMTNGIPLRGIVNNDGYNAVTLLKNKVAIRSFWAQLKIGEALPQGIPIRDLPEEWFFLPSEEDMKHSIIATSGVFYANRLLDTQAFCETNALISKLLSMNSGIVDLHRNLLICDKIYCEIIAKSSPELIHALCSKEQRKFMNKMKHFPSVLRTEYALTLYLEHNPVKAKTIRATFEEIANTYPYAGDIQSERALMNLVETMKL